MRAINKPMFGRASDALVRAAIFNNAMDSMRKFITELLTPGPIRGTDIVLTADNPSATFSLNASGRTCLGTPNSAPTDADIANSQMSAWYDEGGNLLTFRIRKSDGTYVTKTL